MKKLIIFLFIILTIAFCPILALADSDTFWQEQKAEMDIFNTQMAQLKAMTEQVQSNRRQEQSNKEWELYKAYLNGDYSPEAETAFYNKVGQPTEIAIKNALPEIKKAYNLPTGSGSDLYASEIWLNNYFLNSGVRTKEEHDKVEKTLTRDFCLVANLETLAMRLEYGIITKDEFNKERKEEIYDYKNKRGNYSE
ncbi:MAG: hypothetical protein ABSE81_06315 [Candidatus Omnitrophota bacterium]|jgi:hypothetical protein